MSITKLFKLYLLRGGLAILLLVVFGQQAAVSADDGFLDPEKAFVMRAEMIKPNVIGLHFKIANGYYMYRERFSFAIGSNTVKIGEAKFPEGQVKYDPTFNKEMELYLKDITIELPLVVPTPNVATTSTQNTKTDNTKTPESTIKTEDNSNTLTVNGQGCAVAGLCYPPMDFIVKLEPSQDGKGWIINEQKHSGLFSLFTEGNWRDFLFEGNDLSLAELLSSSGLLEITLLFFLLGVLLALTPCVLPMVPILSVLLVGEQHHVSRARGLILSATYVAGMSVVYTALGVAAGLSGAGLAAWLQTPWVLTLFALLLATLALAMFDVFQFQMPASIQTKLIVKNSHILGGRVAAAAMMGALSALIVGPCVAAPLAGALLYISQTGDVVLGGSALFAMAWGMGIPLLLMGATSGKLMPRTGPWMEGIKKFFGLLLFATAWWMVTPILQMWIQILGWAILAMLSAMLLRTFDPLPEDAKFSGFLRKTLGMLLVLLCAIWLIGIASGGRSLLQPLSHLAAMVQPSTANATFGDARIPPSEKNTTQSTAQSSSQLPSQTSSQSTRQALIASSPKQQGLLNSNSQNDALSIQNQSTIKVGPLLFKRVKSVAELEYILSIASAPVMLDFYADWCVSCKEMEAFTFVEPNVVARMEKLIILQADVTANNADDRALLKRFKLFGPPGIIFFSSEGKERRDIRVVGFQDAKRFAATLDRVLK